MANKGTIFGPTAVRQIGDTIRAVKGLTQEGVGYHGKGGRPVNPKFLAKIGSNITSGGTYFLYAWTEQYQ